MGQEEFLTQGKWYLSCLSHKKNCGNIGRRASFCAVKDERIRSQAKDERLL